MPTTKKLENFEKPIDTIPKKCYNQTIKKSKERNKTMMNEMTKLMIVLNTLGIAHTITYQEYYGNVPQIWLNDRFDVICHEDSMGGKDGLLEMWDLDGENDDTIGYLTAKDVITYILNKD